MDSFEVGFGFTVRNEVVARLPEKDRNRLLEAHLDDVMVELMALDDATDPSVSVTFSTGEVEISVSVEARSEKKAYEKADTLIRTAVHAAGGFTGNWEIEWRDDAAPPATDLVDA